MKLEGGTFMFRTLKMMVAGLAAAVLMTGSASALTSVSAGGSYDVTSDNAFIGLVRVNTANGMNTGRGSYTVNFFSNTGSSLLGKSNASITNLVLSAFTGLTMSWVDTATNTVLRTTSVVSPDVSLNTIFGSVNPSQNLVFNWQGVKNTGGVVGFDFDVAAVPLPAGGLLLLTALGGLALTRRRKAVS
ncbi:VPLPA-CTERM sorting domain-containing protein [Ruegeria lacuscaerulensis]|uniref:VPLPA-CTERM sorting domain-containing protein n=1 Tax=Ruegeria lacuscaerulensis TaxID=55218 RepID=UPI00147F2803|nr:VPLPA-CTERM sorting domain-containing protein [Ruegeria lacuscaerulensis]